MNAAASSSPLVPSPRPSRSPGRPGSRRRPAPARSGRRRPGRTTCVVVTAAQPRTGSRAAARWAVGSMRRKFMGQERDHAERGDDVPQRLGVDVGGTFTDAACWDGRRLHVRKLPSTPPDFQDGVLTACDYFAKRGAVEPDPRLDRRHERAPGAEGGRRRARDDAGVPRRPGDRPAGPAGFVRAARHQARAGHRPPALPRGARPDRARRHRARSLRRRRGRRGVPTGQARRPDRDRGLPAVQLRR